MRTQSGSSKSGTERIFRPTIPVRFKPKNSRLAGGAAPGKAAKPLLRFMPGSRHSAALRITRRGFSLQWEAHKSSELFRRMDTQTTEARFLRPPIPHNTPPAGQSSADPSFPDSPLAVFQIAARRARAYGRPAGYRRRPLPPLAPIEANRGRNRQTADPKAWRGTTEPGLRRCGAQKSWAGFAKTPVGGRKEPSRCTASLLRPFLETARNSADLRRIQRHDRDFLSPPGPLCFGRIRPRRRDPARTSQGPPGPKARQMIPAASGELLNFREYRRSSPPSSIYPHAIKEIKMGREMRKEIDQKW